MSTGTLPLPGAVQAPVAAAPAVDANGQPVAVKEKKARPKKVRVKYRAEGALPLEGVPADFNLKTHLPLSVKDFKTPALYFHFKANMAQKAMEKYAKLAAEAAALGNVSSEEAKEQKKLLKLRDQFKAMEAKLLGKMGQEKVTQLLARVAQQAQVPAAGSPPTA